MLRAEVLATISGVIISCIEIVMAIFIAFPNLLFGIRAGKVMEGATAQPCQLLWMLLAKAIIGNIAVGAFILVIVSYGGKRDQTVDKPVQLETNSKPDQNQGVR